MILYVLILLFIGIAAGLAWYLIYHDHGEREPVGALWIALALGCASAFPAAYIESSLLHLSSATQGMTIGVLTTYIGVGVIEEACKFFPLAFFIYRKRYFNEHTDGVIYFALAGIGFGVPENILYTVSYGAKAGIVRIVLTPIFHAATMAMVGYFLAKGKIAGKPVFYAGGALVAAMLLHGFYDFGLSSKNLLLMVVSFFITFSLSTALFFIYSMASERDQKIGLSAVGHNAFCRSCGYPNPNRNLYCARCGKNA
jgi:RsiW-degrading membrane proteinase PrsW (M82 family)